MPSTEQPRLWALKAPRASRGRARRGFDAGLAALRRDELLDPQLEGLVALGRVLADELDGAAADDDESRFVRARVAAAYQAALVALLDRTAGSPAAGGDAALTQLLAALDSDAQLEQLEAPADAPAVSDTA